MSEVNEQSKRVLLLLKLDAKNLHQKVVNRYKEYLEIFAAKRSREHYADVFRCRYPGTNVSELAHCSTDTIMALDQYYHLVEELKWYLEHTTDMPATIEAHLIRELKKLEKSYSTLSLYLDAELGIKSGTESEATKVEADEMAVIETPLWGETSSDVFTPVNDNEGNES